MSLYPPLRLPKIGIFADVHMHNFPVGGGNTLPSGLNSRGSLCAGVLDQAMSTAFGLRCKQVYVAGDLFHSRRPEPSILASAQQVFQNWAELPVTILPGNHDLVGTSAAEGNTACEPLRAQASVVRIPSWNSMLSPKSMSVLSVPFTSEVPMHEHLRQIFEGKYPVWPTGAKVLVTHIGVTDKTSPPWLVGKPDSVDSEQLLTWLESSGFVGAFVGNYHKHQMWARNGVWVCQVGTLIPSGHGDEGLFPSVGGLATYQLGDAMPTMHEVNGSRFLTLKAGEVVPANQDKNHFFIRALVSADGKKATVPANATVTEIPDAPASELGPIPDKEILTAEEAVTEWCVTNNVGSDALADSLVYLKKTA